MQININISPRFVLAIAALVATIIVTVQAAGALTDTTATVVGARQAQIAAVNAE